MDQMDQEPEIRRYKAGDELRIRLTVEHEFEFPSVIAVFQHESFDPTIEGRGEQTHAITLRGRDVRQSFRLEAIPAVITSYVALSGKVTAEKVVGEYRCRRLEADYRGGRLIPFDLGESPDLRFQVVEEPVQSPKVTEVEFL